MLSRREIDERLAFLLMPESQQAAVEDHLIACWKNEIAALETAFVEGLEQWSMSDSTGANTLREYAAIVEAVATMETEVCPWCNAWMTPHNLLVSKVETDGVSEYETSEILEQEPQPHTPDCIYLRAREVRGYE